MEGIPVGSFTDGQELLLAWQHGHAAGTLGFIEIVEGWRSKNAAFELSGFIMFSEPYIRFLAIGACECRVQQCMLAPHHMTHTLRNTVCQAS